MINKSDRGNGSGKGTTSPSNNESLLDGGSLEKIQEILFGEQSRAFEARLVGVADELGTRSASLREEFARGLEEVSTKLEQLADGQRSELECEAATRTDALGELRAHLEERVQSLGEQLDRRIEESRVETRDLLSELTQEFRKSFEELGSELRKSSSDLARKGLSRENAAHLLRGLADAIHGEEAPRGE